MPTDWYQVVTGQSLETGDLISDCPIYSVVLPADGSTHVTEVEMKQYDAIVLSQTCDLVPGREKLTTAVLCPVFKRSEIQAASQHPLANRNSLQRAAQNKEPAFFVLQASDHPETIREVSIVQFRQTFTLPLPFLRTTAERCGPRLRMRSPYREALASRFAAFFARVALPEDVEL